MGTAPDTKTVGPDNEEPLQPTSIEDRLVDLPDESIIDVDVSDRPQLAAEDRAPAEKKPVQSPPATDDDKEQLASLRKQIEEQNTAAQARIRQAEQAAEVERQNRLRAEQSFRDREQATQEESAQRELTLLTQGIEAAQGQLESLEEELARLNEAGEFAKAAKTQGRIARTAATLDRLENEKATFEAGIGQRHQPTHEGAVTVPSAASPSAPITATTPTARFEQYLANFAPAAANWIRAHPECAPPEFGGSAKSNAKMLAGHYDALAQGAEINSKDYFNIIEEHTGHRDRSPAGEAPSRPARRPLPSAPPSREVPGSPSPGRTRQVRLSREQQEHALLAFPHLKPQEALAAYARNLVELEAEGKMGRTSH